MKRFLLTSVAFLVVTTGTMAADLRRAPPPAPVPLPIPLFTWTGFYIGGNAGWGTRVNDDDNDFFGFSPSLVTPTPPFGALAPVVIPGGLPVGVGARNRNQDGFVGGGQIGYNYQFTPGSGFVIGLEADVQWVDLNRRDDFFGGFGAGPFGNAFTAVPTAFTTGLGIAPPVAGSPGNVVLFDNAFGTRERDRGNDVFGTVRARVGWAADRWLAYVTGGLAWTSNDNNNNGFFIGGTDIPTPFFNSAAAATAGRAVAPTAFFGNRNNDDIGWTAGGGVEYAITDNFTARVEALYVNIGRDNRGGAFTTGAVGVTNTGSPVTLSDLGFVDDRRRDNEFVVVRGAINYRFSTF